jgi:hypothetical protein
MNNSEDEAHHNPKGTVRKHGITERHLSLIRRSNMRRHRRYTRERIAYLFTEFMSNQAMHQNQ